MRALKCLIPGRPGRNRTHRRHRDLGNLEYRRYAPVSNSILQVEREGRSERLVPDDDPDKTPRCHLPGERHIRPLLRYLSVGCESSGEPQFNARSDTPDVNGLSGALLTNNPNASNPIRLDRTDALTCDQDHGYTHEQDAADGGAMDQFVPFTGKGKTLAQCLSGLGEPIPAGASSNYAVMDYFDGNTVTALWNYAQHFSMSDNSFGTTFGPSTPGALNVTAAQTYGSVCGPSFATINDSACTGPADPTTITANPGHELTPGTGTVYSDADPYFDLCSYLPSSEGGDGNTPATTLQVVDRTLATF